MKLVIVALDAFSVFDSSTDFIFGGIEIETGYYAMGLSESGINVKVITRDQGKKEFENNAVSVSPHPNFKGAGYWEKRKSITGRIIFRLFKEKQVSNEEFYHSLNGDTFYTQGASPMALELGRYCTKEKRQFIFRIASDWDLGGENLSEMEFKKWSGLTYAEMKELLELSDKVLVQTPFQLKLLSHKFGIRSELMFNPISLKKQIFSQSEKEYDGLWVGKSSLVKRPELFIQLAKECPQLKFCMIFNKLDLEIWENIVQSLPANIFMIESVPADKIELYFLKSRLLINTSTTEGLANTFLQAALNGVPIISTNSDPNKMLTDYGAGILTGESISDIVSSINELLNDQVQYKNSSKSGRDYVEKFHDSEKIIKQFFEIINRKVK